MAGDADQVWQYELAGCGIRVDEEGDCKVIA